MADISKITLPKNGGTYNLKDAEARLHGVYYGECSTAAATQAKAVTISGVTALYEGLSVRVKFTSGQTYNGAPTLNVNSLGANNIRRLSGTNAAQYEWVAGEVLDLIYDGTNWVIVDGGIASTTYYGVTKLSSETGSSSEAVAATPKAVKAAYDLAASKTANTGTVTNIATGVGLTGGPITVSGEIKVKLKSETKLSNDAVTGTETAGKIYPVVQDKSGNLAVSVPWTDENTTYSAGTGISFSGTTINNSGVRSVATGSSNGTISVNTGGNTVDVSVKGLGSAAYTASTAYIAASLKGANNGVAELDSTGKVPSAQLPAYVDDVLEYDALGNFPSTGESGKIYVAKDTNKTYRWSGTAYVEISASLALGTTSSTAFRGDYGQAAYTHAVTNKGSAFNDGLYKITTNSEGHVISASAVVKADITALGIPGSDTDTHHTAYLRAGASGGTANASTTTGNTYLLLVENGANRSGVKLNPGDNMSIISDASGNVTFTAVDTKYTANTTSIGSASAGDDITATQITAWSAGTTPTLGTAIAADDITAWDAGTLPTLGTAIAADDITSWSAGTAPALTITSTACDDITAWSAGTAATASYAGATLTIKSGTAPSLSYTARTVGSASNWSAGTVPSLSYTARSIPNVTGVGALPNLEYTARSIPNVTSVGSAPSLTKSDKTIPNITVTQKTVATGITAS